MIEESVCPKVRHFDAKALSWQAIKFQMDKGEFSENRKRTTVRYISLQVVYFALLLPRRPRGGGDPSSARAIVSLAKWDSRLRGNDGL
jgi:hypothetical protein